MISRWDMSWEEYYKFTQSKEPSWRIGLTIAIEQKNPPTIIKFMSADDHKSLNRLYKQLAHMELRLAHAPKEKVPLVDCKVISLTQTSLM